MREVFEAPAVTATLDRLWQEGHSDLVERIEDIKDWIAAGDARARQHRVESPPLATGWVWVITLRHQGDDWLLAWSEVDGRTIVHAVMRTALPSGR